MRDAWTRPELLKQWFCPQPWQAIDAGLDLRPGGIFRAVMRGPEGQQFDNAGCFLEVVAGRRLVWTASLDAGYRPKAFGPDVPTPMTAIVTIEPTSAGGTTYTATVLHADVASRQRHEAMAFHRGWSTAFDQLVALAPH